MTSGDSRTTRPRGRSLSRKRATGFFGSELPSDCIVLTAPGSNCFARRSAINCFRRTSQPCSRHRLAAFGSVTRSVAGFAQSENGDLHSKRHARSRSKLGKLPLGCCGQKSAACDTQSVGSPSNLRQSPNGVTAEVKYWKQLFRFADFTAVRTLLSFQQFFRFSPTPAVRNP